MVVVCLEVVVNVCWLCLSGRGKRSPKQRKKLNGGLSDADKDRLISNDSDGTYRKYPGVSNVAYVVGTVHTHTSKL